MCRTGMFFALLEAIPNKDRKQVGSLRKWRAPC